jgi:hypothetical protein
MRAPLRAASTVLLAAACGGGTGSAPPAPPASPAASAPPPPATSAPPPPATSAPASPPALPAPPAAPAAPSFADDLAFLSAHGKVLVLESPTGGRVALSAAYQGRVMTSAVEPTGQSCGWINRGFIEAGKTGTQFDNFGGEDRFWLGPEGGQFGLYFPPGKPFTFDAWQVPHAMQEGAWDVRSASSARAVFTKKLHVTNWSAAAFDVGIDRAIAILSREEARTALGFDALGAPGVKSVAFASTNTITNDGKTPWTRDKGLVSIWILAMYAPAADGQVIVPFAKGAGPIVNDAYFGKVPADRLTVEEDRGVLFFKVDGKQRGKIGLGPARAKSVLGSYSPAAKLLTIVQYDKPRARAAGHAPPYVNSMWEQQKQPFGGDVVNSYNDGPPAPGKPPLGGFYEIETSSPGAELAPGASLAHTHRTFHFVGERDALEPIAKAVLGVSLPR